MSSQRRLAIVPGSDMISPTKAQRILAEHQFSDCTRSPNYQLGPGFGQRRSPSPPKSRKLRLQIPEQFSDPCLSDEAVGHDEQQNETVKRRKSKLNVRSINTFRDVHRRRKAGDSDHPAHKKREQMKASPDHRRRYSNTGSRNLFSLNENVSGAKRHSNADTCCHLEARNSFIEVGNFLGLFQEVILIHHQQADTSKALGCHSPMCSISPCDTSMLDSAPFRRV